MSIDDVLAAIDRMLEQDGLSKVEEMVFRQCWEGRSYLEIAQASGYDDGYIKDIGYRLWQRLSKAYGEKVTKQNFKGVLKRFLWHQDSHPSTTTPEQPTAASARLHPFPALKIAHNLPVRDFDELIGRDRELSKLLETLSYHCPTHCISIEGIGGMGKTTLAMYAAYRSLQPQQDALQTEQGPIQPGFDAIIFTSAKQERLTAQGVLPRLKPERSLRDIFRAIARTLNRPDILLMDFEEQIEHVQDSLSRQPTLLIVDNLETLADWQSILGFLYDLPSTVKVVITSRQQSSFASIRLEPLPEPESLDLIQQQARIKGVSLSSTDVQTLHQYTSGVPAAIVYAVGQLAAGYSMNNPSSRLMLAAGDYAHFYFRSSMSLLHGTLPHHLLMALALFPGSAAIAAIADVAGGQTLSDTVAGLAQLMQLSLVSQRDQRYSILALTRDYALAELTAHPEFEQAARDRWVNWYCSFAQQHGGKDWKEWNEYALLEQEWDNLQAVIEWCIASDRYHDVRQLWQNVNCFTHSQGYQRNRLNVWNIRLDWADWLIHAAEQQPDWSTVLDVMVNQGWTLTLLGQSRHWERAATLYARAWELRHHKDTLFQSDLAVNMAVLHIQQQQFAVAREWLQQAHQLLERATGDRPAIARSMVHIHYYQGEICYKTNLYSQSRVLFEQVLAQAEQLQWQRAIFLAKGWLADIAIQEQNFNHAQQLLEEGMHAAEVNRDACRLAFCQRSLAHLERARGNGAIAQQWAITAKQRFEELGMLTEATETANLLQMLS